MVVGVFMYNRLVLSIIVVLLSALTVAALESNIETTKTGIALDAPWKIQIYEFAKKNVVHPSWGLGHSERNYQMTKAIAKKENITIDEDVLFAATFFHDVGGLPAFEKTGVDHAVRSVEVAEPLLAQWGFPAEKWPAVKEMILGHTYYEAAPTAPAAQAFRDADIVDFLGAIGAARILAVTQEGGKNGSLSSATDILTDFANTMPQKCSLLTCKEIAAERKLELQNFIEALIHESMDGKAL